MISLKLFLLVASLICLFLASLNIASPRVNLTALGLFFFVLTFVTFVG
jgi:hypothetical protein